MSGRDVLVVVEIQRGAVVEVVLELLTAARHLAESIGGEVVAALLSNDAAAQLPALAAADRILAIESPQAADYVPELMLEAAQAAVAATQPRAVLVGSTSIGWDVAPLLAARLDAPLVVGCKAISAADDMLMVSASFCGGKILAEVEVPVAPAVLMVLPGSFRPDGRSGKSQLVKMPPPPLVAPGRIRFEQWILPAAGDIDITQQPVLVSVGRGIQQKDNIPLAEELAQLLGGAVSASRPVVDQGWLPLTRQVGKSGMTVKPNLYLALGISGAPEHQEGMKDSELIICVNTDAKAPIFDFAHYGAQADAVALIPLLQEAIQAKKRG